jgi:DNA-binding transcriptional ArsR family regulator
VTPADLAILTALGRLSLHHGPVSARAVMSATGKAYRPVTHALRRLRDAGLAECSDVSGSREGLWEAVVRS